METYSINFRISDNNEWSKGFVLLQPDTGWMWLKDYMKKTLRKGFIDNITLNEIKSNGNWPSRYGGKKLHFLHSPFSSNFKYTT
jgi:hypothetical protein